MSFGTAKWCVITEVYETGLRTLGLGQLLIVKQIAITTRMMLN